MFGGRGGQETGRVLSCHLRRERVSDAEGQARPRPTLGPRSFPGDPPHWGRGPAQPILPSRLPPLGTTRRPQRRSPLLAAPLPPPCWGAPPSPRPLPVSLRSAHPSAARPRFEYAPRPLIGCRASRTHVLPEARSPDARIRAPAHPPLGLLGNGRTHLGWGCRAGLTSQGGALGWV